MEITRCSFDHGNLYSSRMSVGFSQVDFVMMPYKADIGNIFVYDAL